jgi:hypothetical protein
MITTTALPIGYNLTQCDIDECGGNGICGAVHRCQCDPGWVPPRCVLDLTSSYDRYVVDTWHHVTTAVAAVILTIGIWRAMLLYRHKYNNLIESQANAVALFGRWLLFTTVMDSQLLCIITTSLGAMILMIALILGIMRAEIQHYLLHLGCMCVITAIALYVRVFAMIVTKYAARTITIVRWLDRATLTYMIILTTSIVLRPAIDVQNTSW